MICTKCGQALVENSSFCFKCGAGTTDSVTRPTIVRPGVVTLLAVLDLLIATCWAGLGTALLITGDNAVSASVGVVFLVLATLQLATGIGLLKLASYGRVLQILLAIVGLLAFPVGTLICTMILVYMFSRRTAILFSGKDGILERQEPAGATADFNRDIVFADGEFVQYPG